MVDARWVLFIHISAGTMGLILIWTMSITAALPELEKTGLRDDFSIIELNDAG